MLMANEHSRGPMPLADDTLIVNVRNLRWGGVLVTVGS